MAQKKRKKKITLTKHTRHGVEQVIPVLRVGGHEDAEGLVLEGVLRVGVEVGVSREFKLVHVLLVLGVEDDGGHLPRCAIGNPQVQDFLTFLEQEGGIYYMNWGDAPIHTLVVLLFALPNQVTASPCAKKPTLPALTLGRHLWLLVIPVIPVNFVTPAAETMCLVL